MKKHFLEIAHEKLKRQNLGYLWLPGSTAWRHFTDVGEATIRRARRAGYLAGSGIPGLTVAGYQQF